VLCFITFSSVDVSDGSRISGFDFRGLGGGRKKEEISNWGINNHRSAAVREGGRRVRKKVKLYYYQVDLLKF